MSLAVPCPVLDPDGVEVDRALAVLQSVDPLLRLHVRVGGQSHPRHRATRVMSIAGFSAPTGGRTTLLSRVVAEAGGRGEPVGRRFAEGLVRPVVAVFRRLLEHGWAGPADRPGGVLWEISEVELRATGRISVTGAVRLTGLSGRAGRMAVAAAADALHQAVTTLTLVLASDLPAGSEEDLQGLVDSVVAEELRFMDAAAAEVLNAGDHPLAGRGHSVPGTQDGILGAVITLVQRQARAHRYDPGLAGQPIVMLDLDHCVTAPADRTVAVLALLASRWRIPELPAPLPALPGFAYSTWPKWLDATGLNARYPEVDWATVHEHFLGALAWGPREVRTDLVTPGVVRFVRDVEDAGGRVVICTGRREPARRGTGAYLAAIGLGEVEVLTRPHDAATSVAELKAEQVSAFASACRGEVVAVVDDLAANRAALATRFPAALPVAVALPGFTADHTSGEVITSYERTPPRRGDGELVHTTSVAELPLAAMRPLPAAADWAIHLDQQESERMLRGLARRAGEAARKAADDLPDGLEPADAIHRLLTSRRFHRGRAGSYPIEALLRDVGAQIARREPIRLVLPGFPVKQCDSGLKASGPQPDLAEFGALLRMRELQCAIGALYRPGIRIIVPTDGLHFRRRPASLVDAYARTLRRYVDVAGIPLADPSGGPGLDLRDVDELAAELLGADTVAIRAAHEADYLERFHRAVAEADLLDNPLRALHALHENTHADPARVISGCPPWPRMFRSILHMVPIPAPAGWDQVEYSRAVYADPWHLDDTGADAVIRAGRCELMITTRSETSAYLAAYATDLRLGYPDMYGPRIRGSFNNPGGGRWGFAGLGGAGPLPWHGAAAVSSRREITTVMQAALDSQGFVPVHSPLVEGHQAFFHVPAHLLRLTDAGPVLPPGLVDGIRLRRK